MLLGAHVSIAGGVQNAPLNGTRIGCDVIQMFSKNQRQWAAKPYSAAEIEAFRTNYRESGLQGVMVHDTYLINLASPDAAMWAKSKAAFLDEARRCDQLGVPDLVFHPGAHMGQGVPSALKRIAEAMTETIRATPDGTVRLTLETMAGQGTTVGERFEQLAEVLALVGEKKRTGVCLDTCHAFAAGYDLATAPGYAETMRALDRTVGLQRVTCVQLNDSKVPLGGRVDRHEDIGKGQMGLTGFALLMNDERFAAVPMALETPGDDEGYKANLKVLRGLVGRPVPKARRATLDVA